LCYLWGVDAIELLTPLELDELLHYRRGRTIRLARKGFIPYVQLPDGEIRFQRSVIEQWLREREVRTCAPA